MIFDAPLWLSLLLLIPLVVRWGMGLGEGAHDPLHALGDPGNLRANSTGRVTHWVFPALAALTLVSLSLGLARLRGPEEVTLVEGRGLALLVANDVRRSMGARDLLPNRFDAARLVAEGLAARLEGDRLGLALFAGVAHLQCPFTLDRNIFRRYLAQAELGSLPTGGTDLAGMMRLALDAMESGGQGAGARHVLEARHVGQLPHQEEGRRGPHAFRELL